MRERVTINVPVVFMARYVMVLRSATSLRGTLEGVGGVYLYGAVDFLNVLKKGCWWVGGVLLVHSEIYYVPVGDGTGK